ncbi:GH25 family lysozyme [Priestia megaterium]
MQNPSSQTWQFGIDVSAYQGDIDWAQVKTDPKGVKYAYLRVYGSTHTTIDAKVVRNATEAKKVSIPTGGYFYAVPKYKAGTTEPDLALARSQAQLFIDGLQSAYGAGKYGDLMPFMDLEDSSAYGDVLKMTVDQMLDWAMEFRTYFEKQTGVKLGLYAGHYFINDQRNKFNDGTTARGNILKDMKLWVAAYEDQYPAAYGNGVADTGGWTKWTINQYSQQGTITGITGAVDLDRANDVNEFKIETIKPVVASASITIVDLNDPIIQSTAPTSPKTGQLWIDTSVTPNIMKRWSGTAWVKITPTTPSEVGAYTKTEVDTAVNGKVSTTTYTTGMAAKANTSDVYTKGEIQESSANNLVHNAEWKTDTAAWILSAGFSRDTSKTYVGSNTIKCDISGLTADTWTSMYSEFIPVFDGQPLVASGYVMTDDITTIDSTGIGVSIQWFNDSGVRITSTTSYLKPSANNSWSRITSTANAPVGTVKARIAVFPTRNGRFWLARPMLQYGKIASTFTPHVDELATGLSTRVSSNESTINQLSTDITLSVKKSEYDALQNAVKKVRYVRNWVSGSSANNGNHWTEIKVMSGTVNRAKNIAVTSNQTLNVPVAVTDEIVNTTGFAYGVGGTDQYVQIDLGAVYEDVDYIHIWHYYSDGRRYNKNKVEISENGTTWTTLFNSDVNGTYAETAGGKVFAVNSSALNGMVTRMTNTEATVNVQAGQISSKVSSTDYNGQTIISLVNQTADTYKIQAKNIVLQGAVTVLSDITGNLGTITAGDITGATIRGAQFLGTGGGDAMRVGTNGSVIDSSMAGTIKRFRFQVDTDTYLAVDDNDVFNFVMGGSFNTKIYKSAEHTLFKLGNAIIKGLGTADTVQIRTWDDGAYGNLAAGSITNTGTFYSWWGAEISGSGASMLKLIGDTHAFVSWYPQGTGAGRKAWMGYGAANDTNFSIDSGTGEILLMTDVVRMKVDNGVAGVYFKNKGDTAYIPVYASAFTVNSLRATKKDITPFTGTSTGKTALDEILSTSIYEYHLNEETEVDPKRVGLIYEESPFEVVDLRGNGLDLYAMEAMSWKALQDLNAKLEAKVSELEARLLKLEGGI